MLGKLGKHSCSAMNLLLRLLDQPDMQNDMCLIPPMCISETGSSLETHFGACDECFFSVSCLIYLAVLWPVSVSLPPFFAQTRSFCSFLFSQCIAYSEEAACRYLKTARTSLAAWIIPFLFFSLTLFLFSYLQFSFSVLLILQFCHSCCCFFFLHFFPTLLCSVAQLR